MLGNVRIAGLFISGGHNFFGHYGREAGESPTISVEQVECVAGKGLMGDRFFEHKENHKGQVTFFGSNVQRPVPSISSDGQKPGGLSPQYRDPRGESQ